MENFKMFWSKSVGNKIIIILAGFMLLGIGNFVADEKDNNVSSKKICDGINIVSDCELDGIQYDIYKYHPATEEKSHYETNTTYVKEVTGYCTLCKDGTYSPSCSTGSGTCSHHGGVAKWNAPVYSTVAKYEEVLIVDSPYKAEWHEKVVKE